jgi:hypothetical protein
MRGFQKQLVRIMKNLPSFIIQLEFQPLRGFILVARNTHNFVVTDRLQTHRIENTECSFICTYSRVLWK